MAVNFGSALEQLQAAGLIVRELVADGRTHRCRVEGEREKRGWYLLREVTLACGDEAIVGAFGVWRGEDNGKQTIRLDLPEMNPEQKKAIRDQMRADARRVAAQRQAEAQRAAARAGAMWRRCAADGECDYLPRKGVSAHGVRFTPSGAMVVPMMDHTSTVWGLQFVLSRANHGKRICRTGRDKEYWPVGLSKKGRYHLLGLPTWIVLVAEGYATAATLYEATGLPVAVAFDAGNLAPVVEALRKRYHGVRVLVCADDDAFGRCQAEHDGKRCGAPVRLADGPECPTCGQPHKRKNAGVEAASAIVGDGIQWIRPSWPDDAARWDDFQARRRKDTDFNDLHQQASLPAVRDQVEAALRRFGWAPPDARGATDPGGGGDALQPIASVDELMDRFALIYGHGGAAFDHREHRIVKLTDVRDACTSRYVYTTWSESPGRRMARPEEVGFDPSDGDPNVRCNLWGGWPTRPVQGDCSVHLDLLRYLCSEEDHPAEIYDWVLKWLAYPIQYPGAKLKTALIFHGPQGAGKNMLFEAVAAIYGRYALVVDQDAIEDKYNSLFSAKLFLIGDEVVARQELYHTKNKLKGFVTGDTIRINPKNVAAHTEHNHVNVVFLSNEAQPLVIEEDDRRYCVVWTPPKLSPRFYVDVRAEAAAGGIEALHHFLKHLPLHDFAPHTLPPMTRAKREVIDFSMDSTERFWRAFSRGHIEGITPRPVRSDDLYRLYRLWCTRVGIAKAAPQHIMSGKLGKRQDCRKGQGRHMSGQAVKQATFLAPTAGEHAERPPGLSETHWFTQCVEHFIVEFSDWQGVNA